MRHVVFLTRNHAQERREHAARRRRHLIRAAFLICAWLALCLALPLSLSR